MPLLSLNRKGKGKDNRLTEILASNQSSRKLVRIAAAVCASIFNFPIGQPRGKSWQKRSERRMAGSTNRTRSILCPSDRSIVRQWHERERRSNARGPRSCDAPALSCTPPVHTFHSRVQCIFSSSFFHLFASFPSSFRSFLFSQLAHTNLTFRILRVNVREPIDHVNSRLKISWSSVESSAERRLSRRFDGSLRHPCPSFVFDAEISSD